MKPISLSISTYKVVAGIRIRLATYSMLTDVAPVLTEEQYRQLSIAQVNARADLLRAAKGLAAFTEVNAPVNMDSDECDIPPQPAEYVFKANGTDNVYLPFSPTFPPVETVANVESTADGLDTPWTYPTAGIPAWLGIVRTGNKLTFSALEANTVYPPPSRSYDVILTQTASGNTVRIGIVQPYTVPTTPVTRYLNFYVNNLDNTLVGVSWYVHKLDNSPVSSGNFDMQPNGYSKKSIPIAFESGSDTQFYVRISIDPEGSSPVTFNNLMNVTQETFTTYYRINIVNVALLATSTDAAVNFTMTIPT